VEKKKEEKKEVKIECELCGASVPKTKLRKHIIEHYEEAEQILNEVEGDIWAAEEYFEKMFRKNINDIV
jgi:ribosomal protein S26